MKRTIEKRGALLIGLLAALAGCNPNSSTELDQAYQEWMQTCFGNQTNSCASRLVDINIMSLHVLRERAAQDQDKYVEMFGKGADDIFLSTLDHAIDQEIEQQEAMRPGRFARWILGEGRPFTETGNLPFSLAEATRIRDKIIEQAVMRFKAAGLPGSQSSAEKISQRDKYQALWESVPISQQGERPVETKANSGAADSTCLDDWIAAFRKEAGEDAMIVSEQLNEWEGWCSEGKRP